MRHLSWCLALVLVGCSRSLELPLPKEAAVVTGLAVVATPGKTTLQPVEGALVEIAGAGRTRTNAEGFFELSGLDGTRSTLRLAYDLDGDGTPDRQKTIDLTAFGFKRGRDIALGQVVLGRNAAVTGHLLRGDRAMAKSGHSGTVVFVPEAPFSALTADDGSFTLGELPEGPLTLSSFRAGFDPIGQLLTLRAGEELRLSDEVLPLATRVPGAATLAGTVHAGTRPAQSAQVTLFSSGQPRASATTSAEGAYRFEAVAAGLYDLTVVLDGFESVLLRNVFVTEGDNAVTDVTLQTGTSVVPDAGALLPAVDAGLFPDGGVDPGPPEAFITPAVLPFAYDVDTPLDQIATFSGGASAGVQPCSFQWSVLDGGASLDPPNGPYAASVTLRMQGFGEPNRTVLQLVATDPFGRASPPVTAALQAAVVPIAVVTGPMAFTQGRLVLSGATSSDPWNLQLVEYRWVASPSTAVQLNPVGRTDVEVVARTPGSTTVSLVVRNAFGLESAPFPYVLRVLPGDVDAGVPPGDGGVPPGDGGQKGTAFLASGSLTPDGPLRLWLSQPADPATFTQVKLTAPDGGLITVDSVGARSDLLPDAGVLLTLPFGTRLTANERYQVQLLGLATAGGQTYSFTPPAVPPSVHELARSPMVRASADVNTTGAAVTPGIGVTWAVGEERLLVAAACAADKKVQTYNFFAAGTDGTALPPQNTYSTTVATLQTGRRMHTARIGPEDRLFFHAFAAQGPFTAATDGTAYVYLPTNSWQVLNQTGHASNNAWSTLGPLYGGTSGLKAMFADGRLALRQLSSAGVESAWSFPPLAGSPAPIEVTDAGTWSNTLGLVAAGADFAQPGGTSGDLVVARPTGEAQARLVYAVNTSGSWLASAPAAFSLGAGNLDLRQVRVAAGHHSAMVVAQVYDLSVGSATKLITAALDHGTGQVIATPMLPAATFGGTGFDAVALGPSVYLAAADGMALTLWHAPLDGSGGWSTDPANNITAAGTCFLENPELVTAGAELWVTWVQRCGVNSQVLAAAYR